MEDPDAYRLLDFGAGRRLEQWGPVRTVRPDPRAVERPVLQPEAWADVDAEFEGRVGQGQWTRRRTVPEAWTIGHAGLRFKVKLAPSMHTGLFPEQAGHWAWLRERLPQAADLEILNLFAYTGGASIALARMGCLVTHVDASKPAIGWARRNAALNEVSTIRWIADDVRAFVRREKRRGRRYTGIVLDPPVFGRGAGGAWRLDRDLEPLLDDSLALLAADAAFVLVNVYGLAAQPTAVGALVQERLEEAGHALARRPLEADTLDLRTADGRALPTGCFARAAAPASPREPS